MNIINRGMTLLLNISPSLKILQLLRQPQHINSMAQSLAQLYTHIVFSTKKHFPFIKSEVETELYAYIGGTIKKIGGIKVFAGI